MIVALRMALKCMEYMCVEVLMAEKALSVAELFWYESLLKVWEYICVAAVVGH